MGANMKKIVFTDLATNLYTAPIFTTLEFNGQPFYGTNRQLPLAILFLKNSLAFAKTQFETTHLKLFDDHDNLMLTLSPNQIIRACLRMYLAKITLRPLPKLTERFIFSLILELTDDRQIQLLNSETQAIPQVISWLTTQNIQIDDPMRLASKLDASTTIDFRNFTVLSNGTEFAKTLEIN